MKFSLRRGLVIARREFLATVQRKAFLFTLIGMPLYFAFVSFMAFRPEMDERVSSLERFKALGVVDSADVFANATAEVSTEIEVDPLDPAKGMRSFHTEVRRFATPDSALAALARHEVNQVLVIPADYLATGHLRRYVPRGGPFSSSLDQRPIERWMVRGLLADRAEPERIERTFRPLRDAETYTRDDAGGWVLEDDKRELAGFLVPLMFAMLLGVCIVTGGQYLLQGVSEEKESRILESMLCTVTPVDLMLGKLIGLGGAGLLLVAAWVGAGALLAAPAASVLTLDIAPATIGFAVLYFLLGYLFYASIMTGIGAITNNMREAQQFAFMFTFANFAPFIMLTQVIGKPESSLAVGLSLFPPTAPVTMMLRLAAPGFAVPGWQIALSIAILATAAWLALIAGARLFRVGLLLYGKTPTLPEILKVATRP